MSTILVGYSLKQNEKILQYLKRHWDGTRAQNADAPPTAYDLYKNPLGTHPDLAEYFWQQLTSKLPVACGWVVYGNPVLVRPDSGIIFAFAGGTHTYALRLPETARQVALQAGAKQTHIYSDKTTLELAAIGPEWVFGGWFKQEPDWCLAAYDNAVRL